jgi:hypothetical protein
MEEPFELLKLGTGLEVQNLWSRIINRRKNFT